MAKNSIERNVVVARSLSGTAGQEAMDVFHEDRVFQDLVRFRESPGIMSQCIERARTRFQKAGERAIVEQWTNLYEAGQRLMASKAEMERRKSEYLLLGYEHELKVREKEANLRKLEADIEEHNFRRDKAVYQREHLERFVELPATKNVNENEQKLNEAHERRQLDVRWNLHESLRALHTLIELQHWRRQERDRILTDRSLTAEEKNEDLQFIDDLYQQKHAELKADTRIFEDR